jgi:hypothetical protein
MAQGRDLTTEADIEAAYERARNSPPLPRAISAAYDRSVDVIILHMDNGRRLVIPREDLQGLENATEEQVAHIEIFGGLDVAWPQLDLDHYLPALMEGIYGSDEWMQTLKRHPVAA